MVTFDPRLYGARWADTYDEWHKGLMDDEGAVAALAEFAAGGPVLEFGVGTGRLAVPLAERGIEVTGVDISPEMLAKLRGKSSTVTVVEDDMTTVSLGREFAVAFIAFNSIFISERRTSKSNCSATRHGTCGRADGSCSRQRWSDHRLRTRESCRSYTWRPTRSCSRAARPIP